jgi:hypothetical protein
LFIGQGWGCKSYRSLKKNGKKGKKGGSGRLGGKGGMGKGRRETGDGRRGRSLGQEASEA